MSTAPQLLLPALPASARTARRWVEGRLGDLGLARLEDLVLLLTSEVVTNAVTHAGTSAVLSLEKSGPGVRVEVHDGSSEPPVRREPSPDALRGRGVALLDDLSDEWGWEPDRAGRSGKTVWFRVLRAREPRHDDLGLDTGWSPESPR
jgi:anti-sigma regulatory factor (Ser/Thr protein kinase)